MTHTLDAFFLLRVTDGKVSDRPAQTPVAVQHWQGVIRNHWVIVVVHLHEEWTGIYTPILWHLKSGVMGLAFLKFSSGNRGKAGEFCKVSVIVLSWGKRHFRQPPQGIGKVTSSLKMTRPRANGKQQLVSANSCDRVMVFKGKSDSTGFPRQ